MSHLVLATETARSSLNTAQFAHDIRNVAATVALHVETLERVAGPGGRRAASAAHNLISKVVTLCNDSLVVNASADTCPRRTAFDIAGTVRQVADLLAPLETEEFGIHFDPAGPFMVLGNAQQIFRVIFNLAYNAVMVARRSKSMTSLTFTLERDGVNVTLRIADDGPGLPDDVRAWLFRRRSGSPEVRHNGYGIAIARELAERNGGTLRLAPGSAGTSFTLSLTAQAAIAVVKGSGRMRGNDASPRHRQGDRLMAARY